MLGVLGTLIPTVGIEVILDGIVVLLLGTAVVLLLGTAVVRITPIAVLSSFGTVVLSGKMLLSSVPVGSGLAANTNWMKFLRKILFGTRWVKQK